MTESTIYPQEIEIDTVKNGVARLLCHWGIKEIEKEGTVYFQYEETVLTWSLPINYKKSGKNLEISTKKDVEDYVQFNTPEIMSFAKASKLSL